MSDMKAQSVTNQNLWPMYKFSRTNKQTHRQTDEQPAQKLYAPNLLMWGDKEHGRLYLTTDLSSVQIACDD